MGNSRGIVEYIFRLIFVFCLTKIVTTVTPSQEGRTVLLRTYLSPVIHFYTEEGGREEAFVSHPDSPLRNYLLQMNSM